MPRIQAPATALSHAQRSRAATSHASPRHLLAETLAAVQSELDTRFGEVMALNRLRLDEHPSGGKMLRPRLLVAMAVALGNGRLSHLAIPAAATVELIHLATLHHDDVLDDSPHRRRAASANHVLGNKASILVGDSLLSAALELLSRTATRAMMLAISRAVSTTLRGEIEQHLRHRSVEVPARHCIAVCRQKTGSLFGLAAQLGAMLASGDRARASAARRCGHHLGTAFQVIDDALDYVGTAEALGKLPGTDYREGVATLPLVRAFARGTPEDRETLETGFGASRDGAAFGPVRSAVIRSGGIEATIAAAERRLEDARALLATLAPPDDHPLLMDYVDDIASRIPGRLETRLPA